MAWRSHDDRLPNLFVPGFTKAGTTTIAAALKADPRVFVPVAKEPQFFSSDELWEHGLEAYLEQHYRGAERCPVRVDATPHYLFYEKAAERLARVVPPQGQRFVVMLRDPVARAYSMYWNMRLEGFETLSFEEALAAERERSLREGDAIARRGTLRFEYFRSGLYAEQIERWQAHLPEARFEFVLMEDLERDPSGVLQRVYEFVGLEPPRATSVVARNPAGEARSPRLQRWLRNPSRARALLGGLLPAPWRTRIAMALLRLNRRERVYPPMPADTEAALRERFASDVRRLAALIGRDLSSWLPRAPQAAPSER
jgi:hypothetical protein